MPSAREVPCTSIVDSAQKPALPQRIVINSIEPAPRTILFIADTNGSARSQKQTGSSKTSPADDYLPIPRSPTSLPPPTSLAAQSSLLVFPGPARTPQTIRSAPLAVPPNLPSCKFSGLARSEDRFAIAAAAVSAASLNFALAPPVSALSRTASPPFSFANLPSMSGNLSQTKAAIRIESAPRASQAPAPPAARKAGPTTAPAKMTAAPALPLRHPVPSLPQRQKTL